MRSPQWAGTVALAAALTGCHAAATSAAHPHRVAQACERGKAHFSLSAGIYAGVGKPGVAKGIKLPFVIVLDERHPSLVGQVQIAIMLNRLYHTAGLRNLALEGSVVEKPPPDLTWFTSLPDASVRRAVALQMLSQGEVSAAEFAAMVLPGFHLHPIEHENQYQVELSDTASASYAQYIVAIAEKTMTPGQISKANALLARNKNEQAIRFIVNTNQWTSQRYRLLNRTTPVVTIGQMQTLGTELAAKAQEVGADVTQFRADLQAARLFYNTAQERSKTMAGNTADLATALAGHCAPIAMNIGAAHTVQVTGFLSHRHMSYAVVSPLSLTSGSDKGDLSTAAFDRKLKGQSVDQAGTIGALLDGRRKPPPSTEQEWCRTKAALMYATVVIARAVAAAGGGGKPPYNLNQQELGLGGSGHEPPSIAIDLSTIHVIPVHHNRKKRYDVLFKVTLLRNNGATLWIRAAQVAAQPALSNNDQQTLDKALKQVLHQLETERQTEVKPSAHPLVVAISPDVNAAVARTPAALNGIELG